MPGMCAQPGNLFRYFLKTRCKNKHLVQMIIIYSLILASYCYLCITVFNCTPHFLHDSSLHNKLDKRFMGVLQVCTIN